MKDFVFFSISYEKFAILVVYLSFFVSLWQI